MSDQLSIPIRQDRLYQRLKNQLYGREKDPRARNAARELQELLKEEPLPEEAFMGSFYAAGIAEALDQRRSALRHFHKVNEKILAAYKMERKPGCEEGKQDRIRMLRRYLRFSFKHIARLLNELGSVRLAEASQEECRKALQEMRV